MGEPAEPLARVAPVPPAFVAVAADAGFFLVTAAPKGGAINERPMIPPAKIAIALRIDGLVRMAKLRQVSFCRRAFQQYPQLGDAVSAVWQRKTLSDVNLNASLIDQTSMSASMQTLTNLSLPRTGLSAARTKVVFEIQKDL